MTVNFEPTASPTATRMFLTDATPARRALDIVARDEVDSHG